jgi:hypothetical protein
VKEFASCNCSWGCPCQFNALPTTGRCEAFVTCLISNGYFGNTRLDGVLFVRKTQWAFASANAFASFPASWLNLSKKGGSLIVGGSGAMINVSPKGHQESVGIPGSGVSYRTRRPKFGKPGAPGIAPHGAVTVAHVIYLILIALVILWILTHVR